MLFYFVMKSTYPNVHIQISHSLYSNTWSPKGEMTSSVSYPTALKTTQEGLSFVLQIICRL